jgi:hypothetical protein
MMFQSHERDIPRPSEQWNRDMVFGAPRFSDDWLYEFCHSVSFSYILYIIYVYITSSIFLLYLVFVCYLLSPKVQK